MTEELITLKRTVENLNYGRFEYMLTGSMAMSFYAVPRMTRDSDILIKLDVKDVSRFCQIFEDEFFLDLNMMEDSVKQKQMLNIFDKETLFKIDLIVKIDNEYEDLKFHRKVKMKIYGFELNVISLEDLVISKLEWARVSESEIQLTDIRNLLAINRNSIDKSYIEHWVDKLQLNEIHSKLWTSN